MEYKGCVIETFSSDHGIRPVIIRGTTLDDCISDPTAHYGAAESAIEAGKRMVDELDGEKIGRDLVLEQEQSGTQG